MPTKDCYSLFVVEFPTSPELKDLARVLRPGGVCVLAGAGMSTPSGIPDYRGPTSDPDRRPPIQYQAFRDYRDTRARYWSGSIVGWPWMMAREPNAAHLAVAQLESMGIVDGVITQNVDGLHQKAGSRNVLELHGNLSDVVCMECGRVEPRRKFQHRIVSLNPGWETASARIAPDGDAELAEPAADAKPAGPETGSFVVPTCTACRGVLKPNIVFFGDSVPQDTVARAFGMVDAASTLLVRETRRRSRQDRCSRQPRPDPGRCNDRDSH